MPAPDGERSASTSNARLCKVFRFLCLGEVLLGTAYRRETIAVGELCGFVGRDIVVEPRGLKTSRSL